MSEQAKELAERFRAFNEEVIGFVECCTEADWNRMCAEDWTVGVVARHIGAGHYGITDLVRMIIDGEKLPDLTEKQIIQMANDHAREHARCTQAEVLDILRREGDKLAEFVAGLSDTELGRTGYLAMMDQDVSAGKFLEMVILQSGGEHFANMKAAVSI